MTPEQIQQIRQQYNFNPETVKLPTTETPQNTEVEKRLAMLDQVSTPTKESSFLSSIGNALTQSEQRFGQDIAGALTNVLPKNLTGEAQLQEASKIRQDTINLYLKGLKQAQQTGGDTQKYIKGLQEITGQPITSYEDIYPALKKTNAQIAGDAAGVLLDIVGFGKLPGLTAKTGTGKVAQAALEGAGITSAMNVASNVQEGKTGTEALTDNTGTAAVLGASIPLAFPFLRVAGRGIAKTGESMVSSVAPVSTREAEILQSYRADKPFLQRVSDVLSGTEKAPQTVAKTMTETTQGKLLPGIFGTRSQIGIQANRAQKALWKDVISPALKKSDVEVNMPDYFASVEKEIADTVGDETRKMSLLDALQSVREDYAKYGNVTLEQLQKFKEGWAEFVPEKFYKGQNIAGNLRQVQALLADKARDTIYTTLGEDVKKAYLDYGNLYSLKEMGVKALTEGGAKLPTGGTFTGLSEIFSSAVTPVMSVAGQVVYRTGKGLQFVGTAGAKTVGDVLGIKSQELKAPKTTLKTQSPAKTNANVKSVSNISSDIPQTAKKASGKLISEEAYTKAKKNFKDNMGRINSGIPVDQIKDLTIMAAYHIERGVIKVADLAVKLAEAGYDLTKEQVQKLLKSGSEFNKTVLKGSQLPATDIEELQLFKNAFDVNTGKFSSPEMKKDLIKFLQSKDIDIASTNDKKLFDHIDDILTSRESLRKGLAPKPTISKELQPLTETLDTLNPTGSVFAEYTPAKRASMALGKNITTYDKTAGLKADELVTVYRGTGAGNKIVPGDFITTNKQLAKDYAGNGKIIETKVKASDILDDITEPLGEEYIYRPKTNLERSK